MHAQEVFLGRRLGVEQLDPVEHAELPGQRDRQLKADRVERMVSAQVVAEQSGIPHNGGWRAHGPTLV
ncbi:hypothetical protein GCM10029964_025500 [Kibdelosporangium lantanae]